MPRLYRLQHEPQRVGHLGEGLGVARQKKAARKVSVSPSGVNAGEGAGDRLVRARLVGSKAGGDGGDKVRGRAESEAGSGGLREQGALTGHRQTGRQTRACGGACMRVPPCMAGAPCAPRHTNPQPHSQASLAAHCQASLKTSRIPNPAPHPQVSLYVM